MAGARPFLGLISIILLAGGILLQLLVILSGASSHKPLNLIYFLQASTNGITNGSKNIPNPARWTFFALCGGDDSSCGPVRAALPFDPPVNFGTTNGVPAQLIGTKEYYYLSRAAFAFFLIALFFAACALLISVFALCARLGSYLTALTTGLALFFQTLAAALMTAWTVKGERAFKANGQAAKLGVYAYGFVWAAVACFFLSSTLFCLGGKAGKSDSSSRAGGGYFGRKRSTKSRGSFRDSESGRRVKDEYE